MNRLLPVGVGRPDDLPPFLGFLGNELAEVGGRASEYRAPQVSKTGLYFLVGETGRDLPIDLVDDLSGRVLGRTNPRPGARFVPRQEVAYRRNLRERLGTCRGGHCQRS